MDLVHVVRAMAEFKNPMAAEGEDPSVAVGEPPPEARVPGSTWAPGSSSSEGAAPGEQAPAPPKRKSARERLLELTELKELGLVTDEEYEQRRAQILAQI